LFLGVEKAEQKGSEKDASTTESQGQIYLVDERFVKRMQTVMHHF
jgi:hypothetical protein